ncbi:DUF5675 family protein [Spirosoma aerophilum]
MNIQIIRIRQGVESTLSSLVIDKVIRGYVLEDTDRGLLSSMIKPLIAAIKIQDRTAIPAGRYQVKMTYSNRFGKVMPELINVPGFGGIRIHKGNYVGNTDGCLLPGQTFDKDKNGFYRVWSSGVVYEPLIKDIWAAVNRNEPVWCEITRKYTV